jgi:hypothetical protein
LSVLAAAAGLPNRPDGLSEVEAITLAGLPQLVGRSGLDRARRCW